MHNCSGFNDPFTFKYLYIPLIKSQLEYAKLLWDIYNTSVNNFIEIVQNKALHLIGLKCNIERAHHSSYR